MIKLLRRIGRYFGAALGGKFDELADPKVQLEQAIAEVQDQHRRLRDQAANVIAHQKQTEMRLNRAMEELEKTNGSARQAVLMAEEAGAKGDTAKLERYTRAAETFATRLVAIEKDVESLKSLHLQATQAADDAKAAVAQNATALQTRLGERQKLLSQLDQAKMQEQLNRARAMLAENLGQDVPTLAEVRRKIETRYAKALGTAEVQDPEPEVQALEIEQAQMQAEAQARLGQIRSQLGLPSAGGTVGESPPA